MTGRWSPEDIQTVKAMYLDGKTYGEITKAIGKDYTRRAISGAVRRLRQSEAFEAFPNRICDRTAKMTEIRMANKKVREETAKKPPNRHIDSPLGHEPFRFENGDFVTLETVSDKFCRRPIGDPSKPDFHYCGLAPKEGSSYCALCHSVLMVPVKHGATISAKNKEMVAHNMRATGLIRAFGG